VQGLGIGHVRLEFTVHYDHQSTAGLRDASWDVAAVMEL
jgi:hypothetical protein